MGVARKRSRQIKCQRDMLLENRLHMGVAGQMESHDAPGQPTTAETYARNREWLYQTPEGFAFDVGSERVRRRRLARQAAQAE